MKGNRPYFLAYFLLIVQLRPSGLTPRHEFYLPLHATINVLLNLLFLLLQIVQLTLINQTWSEEKLNSIH